jgi:Flp pilus assembly protein TadD
MQHCFLALSAVAMLSGCSGMSGVLKPGLDNKASGAFEVNAGSLENAEQSYRSGKWSEALEAFESLSKQFPRNSYIWLRLGNSYAKLGRFEDAALSYNSALAVDPSNTSAAYNMGVVRLAQAEAAFQFAREHGKQGAVMQQHIQDLGISARALLSKATIPESGRPATDGKQSAQ